MPPRSSRSRFRTSLLLGALLVALVQWGLLSSLLAPVSYYGGEKLANKVRRLRALDAAEDVEVLAVGPSFVDHGFDARRFTEMTGRTAFNMGVPGTDLVFQSLFVRHVLIPRFEPELLLWAVRDSTRTKSKINDQYLNAPVLRRATQERGRALVSLEECLPQYQKRRLHAWYTTLFEEPETPLDAYGLPDMPMQRERRGDADEDEGEEDDGPRSRGQRLLDDYSVSEEVARREFEETLRFAKERGIEVILFLTPYYETTFRPRSNYSRLVLDGEYSSFHGWLTETLAENDVPLVNMRYAKAVSTQPSFFYDSRHLNRRGAAAATEILARIVLGETSIPPGWRQLPSRAELALMRGETPGR